MYERLKRLHLEGKLSENGVYDAVKRGWIAMEEATEIVISAVARELIEGKLVYAEAKELYPDELEAIKTALKAEGYEIKKNKVTAVG